MQRRCVAPSVCLFPPQGGPQSVPAVVIIPVDVEDFLAFDGEHSRQESAPGQDSILLWSAYPESTHSVKPVDQIRVNMVGQSVDGAGIPVPRTMTSYSGAISSMLEGQCRGDIWEGNGCGWEESGRSQGSVNMLWHYPMAGLVMFPLRGG